MGSILGGPRGEALSDYPELGERRGKRINEKVLCRWARTDKTPREGEKEELKGLI